MKYSFAFAALAAVAAGKEIPKDEVRAAELYDNGVMHERIMAEKFKQWDRHAELRLQSLAEPEYPELHFAQCRDGKAVPFRDQRDFFFRCNNVNLHHFLPHSALGSSTGQGSSSWGWTSEDGREFAIIAQADGAAFAEVIKGGKLRYLGRLPQTAGAAAAIWREIRVFKHYIVVGSESYDHHIQIFDLEKLLDIDWKKPVTFDPTKDVTGFYGVRALSIDLIVLGMLANMKLIEPPRRPCPQRPHQRRVWLRLRRRCPPSHVRVPQWSHLP